MLGGYGLLFVDGILHVIVSFSINVVIMLGDRSDVSIFGTVRRLVEDLIQSAGLDLRVTDDSLVFRDNALHLFIV